MQVLFNPKKEDYMSTNENNNEPNDYVNMKIELTDEEYALVKEKAEEKGVSMSEFITQILEEFVENYDVNDLEQLKKKYPDIQNTQDTIGCNEKIQE
jgi:DNA polymerase/3'-5' exonuclease PolX